MENHNPADTGTQAPATDAKPEAKGKEVASRDEKIELAVSKDRMQVVVESHQTALGAGRRINSDDLRAMLAEKGLHAPLNETAVADLFAHAAGGTSPRGIVLAHGDPPYHGADGRLELTMATELKAGALSEGGRVDFYERGIVQSVAKGHLLARIMPPERGISGSDVYGHKVPGKDGRPPDFSLGDNIQKSVDGLSLFAAADGMVQFTHKRLSITETFEVNGDVDFSTGNIRMDRGSVLVRGTVRSGFVVHAQGNVVIQGIVEDAAIVAGGDVELQGAQMSGKGFIRTQGSVFAKFLDGARIECDGDVVVVNSVVQCDITAKGAVMCTGGKGRIQGGIIRCDGGVAGKSIGSPGQAQTRIVIGLPSSLQSDLLREQRALQAAEKKLKTLLGDGSTVEILRRVAKERREETTRKIKELVQLRQRLLEVETTLDLEEERLRLQHMFARISCTHVFAGTQLTIGGTTRIIDYELHKESQFFYDPEKDAVESLSFSGTMPPSVIPAQPGERFSTMTGASAAPLPSRGSKLSRTPLSPFGLPGSSNAPDTAPSTTPAHRPSIPADGFTPGPLRVSVPPDRPSIRESEPVRPPWAPESKKKP